MVPGVTVPPAGSAGNYTVDRRLDVAETRHEGKCSIKTL